MPFVDAPRAAEFCALIEARLPEKTLRHVLSVTATAEKAAAYAGADRTKAIQAGLLHDLFKKEKSARLIELAEAYTIPMSETQRAQPKLLHGPVAAEYAKRELGFDDAEVYEAVYWHTTGRPGLGRVGQVVYFADFTEPLRPMAESAVGLAMLEDAGFDAALRYVAEAKMGYVRAKHAVDPEGEAFLAWLKTR